MSCYFSVVSMTSPLTLDGLRRLYLQACLELYRVDWRRSFLAADGKRMLCCYEAPDAESVRLVLRQQGSTQAAVWPAEMSGFTEFDPLDVGRDLIAAEFELETRLETSAIAAMKEAVVAALTAEGHSVSGVFAGKTGGRVAVLVEGHQASSVTAGLRAAGLVPSAVWRCVELDPEPPRLFRAGGRSVVASTHVTPASREASVSAPSRASDPSTDQLDAVIIGAGLSGICALHRLLQRGMRVRVYEAGRDVGGVWYWNRYPGARVDSESYTYGFSFPELALREWRWNELFAGQLEVESYLHFVVDRLDLRRHMRFDTPVVAASYDEAGGQWRLKTKRGEHVAARYLIAAVGSLSAPQLPDYPGVDEFAGESHHTARWPAVGVELAGRRVGVVGTGASGVQVIQTIANDVKRLTVFQRTPTYCVPQRNRPLSAEERLEVERNWSDILATCRTSFAGFIHSFDPRAGLAVGAEVREAKFETLWQQPGFAFWFGNFGDLLMNPEVNAHASDFLRRKIRARVHDPDVARKLLPDHPFGTKRVPLEDGYYEVYNRSNVRLVDLRETPIVRVTKSGIKTLREDHPLDVIVYATGFNASTGSLTRIDIRGQGGRTLGEKWQHGPKTYLGMLVSGFPNLFLINGPQSAVAICNAARCIEQNVEWIVRCIEHLRARGLTRIAPTAAAEQEWTEHVEAVAESTVLGKMKNSWWFGANTPGKPRKVAVYVAGARQYRERCDEVADAGYAGCTMS